MDRRQFILLSAWTVATLKLSLLQEKIISEACADDALGTLKNISKRNGYAFGCAIKSNFFSDKAFTEAVIREVAVIVAEYESKRHVIEPIRGVFHYEGMEKIVKFAQMHRMQVRGHTLVWHAYQPSWLVSALEVNPQIELLTEYIQKVVQHFRGRISSWDVVNEAVNPADGRADGLRNSVWLKAFGPSYIDIAFRSARKADPKVELVYNEMATEGVWKYGDQYRYFTLKLLEGMKSRGVPVDSYGLQAHLEPNDKPINQKKLASFLGEIKGMGLRIQVTELDVRDYKIGRSLESRNTIAADETRRFLDVVLDQGVTDYVITWGLSDRYTWLNDGKIKPLLSATPSPLPLDEELHRKPMWFALAKAFEK